MKCCLFLVCEDFLKHSRVHDLYYDIVASLCCSPKKSITARFWVSRFEELEGPEQFKIVPSSWIIDDQRCWYPKSSRSDVETLVKDNLPPTCAKRSFNQHKIELLCGHGTCFFNQNFIEVNVFIFIALNCMF